MKNQVQQKKQETQEKQEQIIDIDEQMHEWQMQRDEDYISRYEQCI